VVCDTDAVPRESRTVGRPHDPVTKAASILPRWVPKSRRQQRPVFAGELHLHRTSGSRTTAGLHQPLLVHDVGAPKKRHSRCTIACSQERRVLARRGVRYERCAARITHRWPTARPWNRSGGRQPAVLWESHLPVRFVTQSRDTSRAIKSGAHQPAVLCELRRQRRFYGVIRRKAGRRHLGPGISAQCDRSSSDGALVTSDLCEKFFANRILLTYPQF
jgi:hypothetical protein